MSQIQNSSTGGGGGGGTLNTLTIIPSNLLPAVVSPSGGTITITQGQQIANVDAGIELVPGSSTFAVKLSNRITGTVTTTNATPTNIISIALPVEGTYFFSGNIVAYDVTNGTPANRKAAVYEFSAGFRSDGTNALQIGGTNDVSVFEELIFVPSNFDFITSTTTVILQVIGIGGETIHWNAELTYRVVS